METALFLLFFGFMAAFVDSIAGGGGMISLPALLSIGLPPQVALGTNKLQGFIAGATSSYEYIKSGNVNVSLMKKLMPFTIMGGAIGVVAVHFTPNAWLKPIIIILLIAMVIYMFFKKNLGESENPKPITAGLLSFLMFMSVVMGFYDGFFGPGTGSFLLFIFLSTGLNFVHSQANAKILNTLSNLISLIVFIFFGFVHFKYGILMAVSGIIGAKLGTRVAVTKGSKFVKPLFFMMTIWLIGKQFLS